MSSVGEGEGERDAGGDGVIIVVMRMGKAGVGRLVGGLGVDLMWAPVLFAGSRNVGVGVN